MSFFTAARDGQISLLKHHLQQGVDVQQRFNNDRTALHFACDGGNVEIVKILLASEADPNQPDMFNKDTPLHLASEAGHTDVVRILLENRGHVNAVDQMNGETPLHLACEAGFGDIVQLLLEYGADVSIENVYKKQALHYADVTTQEAMQHPRQCDAQGTHLNGDARPPGQPHMDSMSAIQKQILESAVDGDVGGLADVGEVEDDDLIQALEESGPSRALQTQECSTWYAANSIAGRSSDGRDKQNQDAFLIVNELGGDPEVALFGVFDGHGRNGHLVSYFAKCVLPGILSREIDGIRTAAIEEQAQAQKRSPSKAAVSHGEVAAILSDACETLQRMLEEQDKFDCQSSGSTAIFSVVAYGTVYMANVGDSRALLAHVTEKESTGVHDREKLVVVPLSVDQVPNVREERDRVEKSGGVVRRDEDSLTGEQGPFRVWRRDLAGPGLAMSRSIGDVAAHQIGVSALPVVMQYRLSEADRLLIISTDGVWDMLDNAEVVDMAARASGDCKGDPAYAAAQVCQTAQRAWEFKETRVDDITCLLIFLPCQRAAASAAPAPMHIAAPQQAYEEKQSTTAAQPNYGADVAYIQLPHYTSIESEARPAAPSGSYATDGYSPGPEQQGHLQGYQNIQSTAASYIALSRDSYGGQDRAIPYRPADQANAQQPDEFGSAVYGSSAYSSWLDDGASAARGPAIEYGGAYHRASGVPGEHLAHAAPAPSSSNPAHRNAPHRQTARPLVPGPHHQPDGGFFGLANLVPDGPRAGQGQGGAKEEDTECSIQ